MRQPRNLKTPRIGNIITRGGTSAPASAPSDQTIELLGGNVIAILQTAIINHEEEPTLTYRGVFKDADEPVQLAPKPIQEYIWVNILGEPIGDIIPLNWNSNFLNGTRRQLIRDHILLPNNLGIGLIDDEFVW